MAMATAMRTVMATATAISTATLTHEKRGKKNNLYPTVSLTNAVHRIPTYPNQPRPVRLSAICIRCTGTGAGAGWYMIQLLCRLYTGVFVVALACVDVSWFEPHPRVCIWMWDRAWWLLWDNRTGTY